MTTDNSTQPSILSDPSGTITSVFNPQTLGFDEIGDAISDGIRSVQNLSFNNGVVSKDGGFPSSGSDNLFGGLFDGLKDSPLLGGLFDLFGGKGPTNESGQPGSENLPPAPPGYAIAYNPVSGQLEYVSTNGITNDKALAGWKWIPEDPNDPLKKGHWTFIQDPRIRDKPFEGVPNSVRPWLQVALNAGGDLGVVPEGPAREWVRFLMSQERDADRRPDAVPFGLGLPGMPTPNIPAPPDGSTPPAGGGGTPPGSPLFPGLPGSPLPLPWPEGTNPIEWLIQNPTGWHDWLTQRDWTPATPGDTTWQSMFDRWMNFFQNPQMPSSIPVLTSPVEFPVSNPPQFRVPVEQVPTESLFDIRSILNNIFRR